MAQVAQLTERLPSYAQWLELPDDLKPVARDELHEPVDDDLARVALGDQVLQGLRDANVPLTTGWLSYAPEGYAVAYLRWAKWDAKKALGRIKSMDKWVAAAKQGDGLDLRASQFKGILDLGFLRVLGRRAKTGGMIQLLRPALAVNRLEDPTVLLRYNLWTLRRILGDKAMQVHGMLVIESFEGLTFMNAVRFTQQLKSVMSLQMKFMNECAPLRLQAMCMVHEPAFFGFLYAFAKPFMSKKMRQRIRFYGANTDRLHEEVADASELPADFGGTNPDAGEAFYAQAVAQEAEEDAQASKHAAAKEAPPFATVAAGDVTLE